MKLAEGIVVGALVATSDGRELGRVKEVSETAFLVDAPRQFDFWLEKSIAQEATSERVSLGIAEGDLGAYKMDKPQDHNEFKAAVREPAKPSNVRDTMIGGQRGLS